ncbi:hypothetical protein FF100_24595 [Methylobacterium terricola]|uniref:Helix-turn-helix domain-containing protein n=1 Tax=Methylobacterium terricola TaxID=2583531 RepID=A0A5C4LB16_9HYPH|nr:hypothetical protein [Methylobacterium terricola]TNC10090.1 hypothetical protein FF100_24595 [Methylobacterium terricola]
MTTPAASALLRDRLLAAIEGIAGPDWRRRLDALNADAIQAYGSGALHDSEAERVFQAVQDRRDRMAAAAGLHRAKARAGQGRGVTPLGAFAFDRLAALRPVEAEARPVPSPGDSATPRKRATLAERAERQAPARRRAYLGHRLPWPATIKQDFHPAELGVIGVIAREIRAHGTCELALGTIAARARCSRRTVQTAIRWAAHRGYLAIEERVKVTHVIRIASAAIHRWEAGPHAPDPEKLEKGEDLNVPAKVATGSRPAGGEAPTAADATATVSVRAAEPDRPTTAPPSSLDATIAAWRAALSARGGTSEARSPTRAGPSPLLRPG